MTFSFVLGLCVGVLTVFARILWESCFRVEEGHLAVLTSFGAVSTDRFDGKIIRRFQPGLHFKRPWQKVHEFFLKRGTLDSHVARRRAEVLSESKLTFMKR